MRHFFKSLLFTLFCVCIMQHSFGVTVKYLCKRTGSSDTLTTWNSSSSTPPTCNTNGKPQIYTWFHDKCNNTSYWGDYQICSSESSVCYYMTREELIANNGNAGNSLFSSDMNCENNTYTIQPIKKKLKVYKTDNYTSLSCCMKATDCKSNVQEMESYGCYCGNFSYPDSTNAPNGWFSWIDSSNNSQYNGNTLSCGTDYSDTDDVNVYPLKYKVERYCCDPTVASCTGHDDIYLKQFESNPSIGTVGGVCNFTGAWWFVGKNGVWCDNMDSCTPYDNSGSNPKYLKAFPNNKVERYITYNNTKGISVENAISMDVNTYKRTYNTSTGAFALPNLEKDGWIFDGWCENQQTCPTPTKDVQIPALTIDNVSTGNKDFYAQWTEEGSASYTVNYCCSPDDCTQPYDYTDSDVSDNYTMKNFNDICTGSDSGFGWWECKNDKGTGLIGYYKDGTIINVSINMNCKRLTSITGILYDYNNGTCDTDNDCTCGEEEREEINTIADYSINSDVCFVADSATNITLKTELCDAWPSCDPGNQECSECQTYTAKKPGYTLEGWYKNKTVSNINRIGNPGANFIITDDMIDEACFEGSCIPIVILKGNWEPIDFDIVYHNMESGDINPNPSTYNIENVDDNVIKLQNPSRSGYEFLGWCVGDSTCPNPKKGDEAPTVSGADINPNDLTPATNTKHFYAMWKEFECTTNKWLHVGTGENDKICMFTGEPENKPVIRIQKDTDEFYIKLIKDINQVMHPGSTKKFHVQLSNGIYNAYDFIEEDATPNCGLLPLYKNSYEYDFNNTIEQDGNLYVQTHFDVTTGRCECPSTLTTTNNINCAIEHRGIRVGMQNRYFCNVSGCLEL